MAIDSRPPASMLNSYNIIGRFLVEQAYAGLEDAGEAVSHLRGLVTDFDQGSCGTMSATVGIGPAKPCSKSPWLRAGTKRLIASMIPLTPWREVRLRLQNSARPVWQRRGGVEVEASFLRTMARATGRPNFSASASWCRARRHLVRKKPILTHWTADSSPLKWFNWMNCGYWVLEADKTVRVWGIVREVAAPERQAVDGPRSTREIWDSLKFHQLPPV